LSPAGSKPQVTGGATWGERKQGYLPNLTQVDWSDTEVH